MLDADAPIDSDELDRVPVPEAAAPVAIEPVAPFVAAPVAAAPAPPVAVGEVNVDVAGALAELDVVLPGLAVVPLFAAGVVLLLEPAVVVLLDVPVVGPCMFVDVVVCAWSAVVPSRSSTPAMALDRRGIARTTE